MLSRIGAIIRKEFIQMRRDPRTLAIVLALPVMQLLLFGYAINTVVDHLPTIVLDSAGRVIAALGSPGGSSIPAYNAKVLIATLAWKMPMQEAINLPNVYARGSSFAGEASKLSKKVADGLAERGIVVKPGEG